MLKSSHKESAGQGHSPPGHPTIIPRSEHIITRANISRNALKVLYRLKQAGHQAYLVGGGVRDLLLGREPKDFDVATDALPEAVRELFRNSRLIGRRFRLVHVQFGQEIVEVATFRALPGDADEAEDGERIVEDGRVVRDNVYGTIEEDAWRRDFSVNALYYNIEDFSVVDYTGGMADLREGVLRVIGEPETRYREDPVRMLRAVRFAAKLGFRLEPETERWVFELGELLADVPAARLFDEALKLFLGGQALPSYELMRHYDLFQYVFPLTEEALSHEEGGFPLVFVAEALANTDDRVAGGKPVTPAFLLAALLWEPVRRRAEAVMAERELSEIPALQAAGSEVMAEQSQHVAIPRRFGLVMREIWQLQPRFEQRMGKRPMRLVGHPRFRAAYDFLVLRARAGEAPQELADWWTRFQDLDPEAQAREVRAQRPRSGRGRRGRRRGKANKSGPDA